MANRCYKQEELRNIACDILIGLKPKGLLICELRDVLKYAAEALEYIPYGDRPSATESEQ